MKEQVLGKQNIDFNKMSSFEDNALKMTLHCRHAWAGFRKTWKENEKQFTLHSEAQIEKPHHNWIFCVKFYELLSLLNEIISLDYVNWTCFCSWLEVTLGNKGCHYQYIILHQVAQQRKGKNQNEGKMQSMAMLSL